MTFWRGSESWQPPIQGQSSLPQGASLKATSLPVPPVLLLLVKSLLPQQKSPRKVILQLLNIPTNIYRALYINIVVTYLCRSMWVRSSRAQWTQCLSVLPPLPLCSNPTTQLGQGLLSTQPRKQFQMLQSVQEILDLPESAGSVEPSRICAL